MQAYKVVAEKISDSFSGIRKKTTKNKQRALQVPLPPPVGRGKVPTISESMGRTASLAVLS